MLGSLESPDKINLLPDAIRYHFEFNLDHRDYFSVHLTKFSEEQRKVIIEFLRYVESKGGGSAEDAVGLLQEQAAERV